jgi:hypothetical protein
MTSFQDTTNVRMAIYESILNRAVAPSVRDVAVARGLDEASVADAFRALADGHVIVLEPDTLDVRWAAPFSAVSTPFRVRAGTSAGYWYAPCAWDAFGIAAALRHDAEVTTDCAFSGEPIVAGVRNRTAYGTGVIHLLVPAARFWDDIRYT